MRHRRNPNPVSGNALCPSSFPSDIASDDVGRMGSSRKLHPRFMEQVLLTPSFGLQMDIPNMTTNEKYATAKLYVSSRQTFLFFVGHLHPRLYVIFRVKTRDGTKATYMTSPNRAQDCRSQNSANKSNLTTRTHYKYI